jgi:hypothetical protein
MAFSHLRGGSYNRAVVLKCFATRISEHAVLVSGR